MPALSWLADRSLRATTCPCRAARPSRRSDKSSSSPSAICRPCCRTSSWRYGNSGSARPLPGERDRCSSVHLLHHAAENPRGQYGQERPEQEPAHQPLPSTRSASTPSSATTAPTSTPSQKVRSGTVARGGGATGAVLVLVAGEKLGVRNFVEKLREVVGANNQSGPPSP